MKSHFSADTVGKTYGAARDYDDAMPVPTLQAWGVAVAEAECIEEFDLYE